MIYLAVSLQYRNLTDGLLPRLCIASRGKNLARAHNSNNIESWSTNSVHTQNEFEAAYIRPVFWVPNRKVKRLQGQVRLDQVFDGTFTARTGYVTPCPPNKLILTYRWALCGLRGCRNRSAPFPGRMS